MRKKFPAQYHRERRARLRAAGKCGVCMEPSTERYLCPVCTEDRRIKSEVRRNANV